MLTVTIAAIPALKARDDPVMPESNPVFFAEVIDERTPEEIPFVEGTDVEEDVFTALSAARSDEILVSLTAISVDMAAETPAAPAAGARFAVCQSLKR